VIVHAALVPVFTAIPIFELATVLLNPLDVTDSITVPWLAKPVAAKWWFNLNPPVITALVPAPTELNTITISTI